MTNDDNYGPWIDWAGGECPIPDAKYGDYWLKYSDNSTFKPRINAAECTWNPRLRGDGFSIIAYRVSLPADDLLRQAIEALRLYDAFIAMPVDRGGQNGPNGQAFKKFVDAKNAVLAAYDAKGKA